MKTVAVFDDDLSICTMVERLVKKMGFVCVSASTIAEAAFTMGKNRPDIVIADFEFKHELNISLLAKTLQEKAKMVIILTSRDPEIIKQEYPALRFATFIKKGTSMRELRRMIS